ncbi:cation diffusion facilitator family transporter [Bacillus benzoevorans]|uniref:Cation diffusion facilitator family transporter n=1 Tax=Bacillus benzoevorans TaxID=1456 RepID=A0A7X0HT43_9BACI|nr:cation diffusion facilitator family transporter [Bacillus benzoevorans]MBB6445116.1 cation diffusion facilitator family transporter [Bacillus benzoevorans]
MGETNLKKAEKGAWISISAYILLSAIKLTAGKIGHSEALWADGLNNLTDILASAAVLIGLRISQKPPDDNHRYGHSRAETIASLMAALIMFTVGFQVIFQSIQSFYQHDASDPNIMTALVALLSAVFMFAVYVYNLRLSKKLNSKALYSAAQDNRSDALVSVGAAVGILGSYFGLSWLDPLAAVIVGLMICRTAWGIFKEASLDLTDAFEVEKLKELEATINKTPGVKLVKDIKARLHGNRTIVDATIFVEPTLTIVEGHQIAENVEERLIAEHDVQDSNIHIEPQM